MFRKKYEVPIIGAVLNSSRDKSQKSRLGLFQIYYFTDFALYHNDVNITLYANYSPNDETPDPRQFWLSVGTEFESQMKHCFL